MERRESRSVPPVSLPLMGSQEQCLCAHVIPECVRRWSPDPQNSLSSRFLQHFAHLLAISNEDDGWTVEIEKLTSKSGLAAASSHLEVCHWQFFDKTFPAPLKLVCTTHSHSRVATSGRCMSADLQCLNMQELQVWVDPPSLELFLAALTLGRFFGVPRELLGKPFVIYVDL